MPLLFERPSDMYMRELRAVARSAAALRDHFPKMNYVPNDFPQDQVKWFCEALIRLPEGTAEGSIAPLRAADEGLNPIRQRFFHAVLEDEKEPEFGFARDGDLDLRLVSLMAAVRSAIERYKVESGEVLDTDVTPDLLPNPAIEKPRQSAIEAIAKASAEISAAEKAFSQSDDPQERQALDAEERLVKDTGTQVKSTKAVLSNDAPRPSVLTWLDDGFQKTEAALTRALNVNLPKAKKVGEVTGNAAGQLAEIWFPKISKSIKPVREYVRQIRTIILSEGDASKVEVESADFSYVETYNRLLRGDEIPASWIPQITQLDFYFSKLHHLPESDRSQIIGNPELFSNTGLLAALTNLTYLNLNNKQVADVSPLSKLTNLTLLWLSNTQVANVSPLSKLTNLTLLWLSNTQVTDVSPLAKLTNLTELSLDNTQVADVSPLAALTNLTELSLNNTQVKDVTPLAGLTNLTDLWLGGTPLKDVSSLAKFTNLTLLWLSNTQVKVLSPLAKLTNLTDLGLNNTQVKDVSPLAALSNLTSLGLSNTQVADVSPLTGLTKLEDIWLENTRVTDFSPLKHIKGLTIH